MYKLELYNGYGRLIRTLTFLIGEELELDSYILKNGLDGGFARVWRLMERDVNNILK